MKETMENVARKKKMLRPTLSMSIIVSSRTSNPFMYCTVQLIIYDILFDQFKMKNEWI